MLLLGTFMTDINLGIYTANLDPGKCIYATSEQLRIRHHHYHDVLLADFHPDSARRPEAPKQPLPPHPPIWPARTVRAAARSTITDLAADRPAQRIAQDEDDRDRRHRRRAVRRHASWITRGRTEFLSPAYYTSMGFSVPAALGATIARPDLRRVVAIVGDGAFQMTGMELSTIVRRRLAHDRHRARQRRLRHRAVPAPGRYEFNDIQPWAYHKLPEVLGGGTGYEVRTEGEFDAALRAAWADTPRP